MRVSADFRDYSRTVAVLREFGSIVAWVKLMTHAASERHLVDWRIGTPLSRARMKSLPVLQITARHVSYGHITTLAFNDDRIADRLCALMPDLGLHYRAVQHDPVKAHFVEKHIRSIWSRLVDRSTGYWLNGVPRMQVYADA